MSYSFDDNELTSEKSLWDVYKLSRRITPGRTQVVLTLLVMIALGVNAFFFIGDESKLLADVRKWSELGLDFSITTLGFLIAGFTIFATLSKPDMMLAMMDHVNKETGLPTLKYNFFTFMRVFITYIFFSLFYLLVMVLGQSNGFISNLISLLPDSQCVRGCLIRISYVFVGGSIVYLLLLLKSFIFNIYAIVMNMLRWEYYQK